MDTEDGEGKMTDEPTSGRLIKSDLAEAVAVALEMTRAEAAGIVDLVFDSILRALKRSERVELRGFGVFGLRDRGARNGRNPKTGIPVAVPAKRVAFFSVSRRLSKELNRFDSETTEN
jgi:nucleoid DNA-binding protein